MYTIGYHRNNNRKPRYWIYAIVVLAIIAQAVSLFMYRSTYDQLYKAKSVIASDHVHFAMVSVPVPVEDALEGLDVTYKVKCHLEDGILSCEEAE